MKKLSIWRSVSRVLLLFCFLFFAYAILIVPSGGRARENRYRINCLSNLKKIGLASLLYAQDFDSRMMPVSNDQGEGWADLITPYAKTRTIFQCPKGAAPSDKKRSDYFYNARLDSYELKDVSLPPQIIIVGDGYDNGGTNSSLRGIPSHWVTDEDSPAHRHLGFGNYLFADGHVKFIPAGNISNSDHYEYGLRPYSFAPK